MIRQWKQSVGCRSHGCKMANGVVDRRSGRWPAAQAAAPVAPGPAAIEPLGTTRCYACYNTRITHYKHQRRWVPTGRQRARSQRRNGQPAALNIIQLGSGLGKMAAIGFQEQPIERCRNACFAGTHGHTLPAAAHNPADHPHSTPQKPSLLSPSPSPHDLTVLLPRPWGRHMESPRRNAVWAPLRSVIGGARPDWQAWRS
ncbi:hypothetical protein B0T14DRAFT_242560 [Immersiella caudata]|uniref:Uncharacterized protein n=1 Tax=Immersiella caudata TaxID=314043 RepID=A0AA39WIV6_9PEZI|nr:hypothetical protein B0T14DRAFT_242560 [Immersiella caudata]